MRLPEGFSALKDDVGKIIRKARETSEDHRHKSMEQFADHVGISRQTLSSIENGARWPSYAALEALMGALDIEWHEIADKGDGGRPPIPHYPDVCAELGGALRKGRQRKKLTLQQLSALTGMSDSQLSRIERGQFRGSKCVEVIFADGMKDYDNDAVVRFNDRVLDKLAECGDYDRDLGRRISRS